MAKPKAFKALTWAVYNNFGSRKEQGLVSVVVDTETKLVYPVPLGEEHCEFAPKIVGFDKAYLEMNPSAFSRLVPSLIEIEFDEVVGVVTGVSGLELGYGVRHTKEQLELAHALVLAFVHEGEIRISSRFRQKLVLKYVQKV